MIVTMLTGHQYFNSPYESCDSCGTCNGAMCAYCKKAYQVDSKIFARLEDAQAYSNDLAALAPGVASYHISLHDTFLNADLDVYMQAWLSADEAIALGFKAEDKYGNYYDVACSTAYSKYAELQETLVEKYARYELCTCTDKAIGYCANDDCSKFGCRDSRCYREMQAGKRTIRKTYE